MFIPLINKFFNENDNGMTYSIIGHGDFYHYKMLFNHILAFCRNGQVTRLGQCEFIDYAAIHDVVESLDYKLICSDMYKRMQRMASKGLHSSVVRQVYETYNEDWVRDMVVEGIC
jgi:hypothetical protein